MRSFDSELRSGFVVTSLEKFVFVSHLGKPKIRNKARNFPKPITSQTLLIEKCESSYIMVLGSTAGL